MPNVLNNPFFNPELPADRQTTLKQRALPNFIIPGAQKAGTTSLYRYLELHPQVLGAYKKEIHFFDHRVWHGPDYYFYFDLANEAHWRWYWQHFVRSRGRVNGEMTPAYSILPEHRIKELANHLPEIKIIYSLRNHIGKLANIDFKRFNIILAIYLLLISTLINGFWGIVVFILASLLGWITVKLGVERTNLMGAVIIPTLLLLFKVFL